jgi:glycopeptide antibiotics resistance protein
MFIPFGILLTRLFNGSLKKSFAAFITGILTLETAQLILRRGVFDVDDILLNGMGFITGYALIILINKYRER